MKKIIMTSMLVVATVILWGCGQQKTESAASLPVEKAPRTETVADSGSRNSEVPKALPKAFEILPESPTDGPRILKIVSTATWTVLMDNGKKVSSEYKTISDIRVNSDWSQIAFIAHKDLRKILVLSGSEIDAYDDYRDMMFSPDGKEFMYVGKKDRNEFVVRNWVEQKGYKAGSISLLRYSPDGKNIAYMVYDWGYKVVFNWIESKPYIRIEDISPHNKILFSPDGTGHAFLVRNSWKDEKRTLDWWVVVKDWAEGKMYDGVESGTYSPDGKSFAYVADFANGESQWFLYWHAVIKDGVEGKQYKEIKFLTFSPDGAKMAYAVRINEKWDKYKFKWVVVNNGSELGSYEWMEGLVFSPDGKSIIVTAREPQSGRWFVVKDSVKSNLYKNIWNITFSPDGTSMAYPAEFDGAWSVVKDGVESGSYSEMPKIVYSPDSKSITVIAKKNGVMNIVKDGTESRFLKVLKWDYSANGTNISYIAQREDLKYIVVDSGNVVWEYDGIGDSRELFSKPENAFFYSEDRENFAFMARKNQTKYLVYNYKQTETVWTETNYLIFLPSKIKK